LRSSSGPRFAACASSSLKLSIAKPVTELPTERHVDTGSLVCTGVAVTSKFGSRYGVPDRPSAANRSPNVLVENIASSESTNFDLRPCGMPGIAALIAALFDSVIDYEVQAMRAPETRPSSTVPVALIA